MTVWLHDYHAAAVRLINNRMFACACMLVLCCWRAMVLRVVLILQDKRNQLLRHTYHSNRLLRVTVLEHCLQDCVGTVPCCDLLQHLPGMVLYVKQAR